MNNSYRFVLMVSALLASFACYAGDIEVSGVWTRATAPGQDAASVDLTITSKQKATLDGVSSPVAKTSELHSMATEGGMMRMREVKSIELPAGKPFNLGKNGYHLMLNGLKAPLKEGETVALTLSFKTGKRDVKIHAEAKVQPLTAIEAPSPEDAHMQMNMNMR